MEAEHLHLGVERRAACDRSSVVTISTCARNGSSFEPTLDMFALAAAACSSDTGRSGSDTRADIAASAGRSSGSRAGADRIVTPSC